LLRKKRKSLIAMTKLDWGLLRQRTPRNDRAVCFFGDCFTPENIGVRNDKASFTWGLLRTGIAPVLAMTVQEGVLIFTQLLWISAVLTHFNASSGDP
jgi:hypothetical protein